MKKKENSKRKKDFSSSFENLITETKKGDFKSLAQLITLLEENEALSLRNDQLFDPPFLSFRIGITGPLGSGKSTLTEKLLIEFRKLNLKIGILAIDPSSPFKKRGSLLGDRIRYNHLTTDPKIFIRSLSSRGNLGGLNANCFSILKAYDLAHFDISIIETTGIGQSESDIFYLADEVSLILTPESGDTIQFMKAGILEIADQFIINKSDLKGVDLIEQELKYFLRPHDKKNKKQKKSIFKTVAQTGKGVRELAHFYFEILKNLKKSQNNLKEWKKRRTIPLKLRKEAYFLLKKEFDKKILKDLNKIKTPKSLKNFLNLYKKF